MQRRRLQGALQPAAQERQRAGILGRQALLQAKDRASGPVGSPASRVAVVAGCGRQFGRVGADGDGQAGHVGR
jgi:hypothetical protein